MRSFARFGGEVLFKAQFFFLSHLFRSFYFFLMSVATITGGGKGNYTRWRSLDLKGREDIFEESSYHSFKTPPDRFQQMVALLSLMERSWVFTFPFLSFLFFIESVFGVCGYS
ncbi:hypothetical protein Peur_016303 [Populus x canadensis]